MKRAREISALEQTRDYGGEQSWCKFHDLIITQRSRELPPVVGMTARRGGNSVIGGTILTHNKLWDS